MDVVVKWRELYDGDEGWYNECALYGSCTVGGSEFLYIGKADGRTDRRVLCGGQLPRPRDPLGGTE